MKLSILRLPHSASRWELVRKYYLLRADTFVGRLGWDLETINDGSEAESYDAAPIAHYVIAHANDCVLGGARLVRCDTEFGRHPGEMVSYMIRDAFLGRINMSRDVWADGEPPTDPSTWELTRLVSGDRDPTTTRAVLNVCNEYIKRLGATRCLFLTSPAVFRISRRYGFEPTPKGPTIVSDDGGKFRAFECPVV